MARTTDPKTQIAAGVGAVALSLVWIGLQSFDPFQALFQSNPTQEFFATLFTSVILAFVAAGVAFGVLSAIEDSLS